MPKESPKMDSDKQRKSRFLEFHLVFFLLAAWLSLNAVLGGVVAVWPPFGFRGLKKEARQHPKRSTELDRTEPGRNRTHTPTRGLTDSYYVDMRG